MPIWQDGETRDWPSVEEPEDVDVPEHLTDYWDLLDSSDLPEPDEDE